MFGGGRRYGAQPRDPFEDMMDHVFGGSFFGPPFQQQFGGGGIFDDLSRSGTSFGMDPFFADPFFRPPFLQQQQQQYQQRSAPPQVGCTNAGLHKCWWSDGLCQNCHMAVASFPEFGPANRRPAMG
jgi:hypothetical protein